MIVIGSVLLAFAAVVVVVVLDRVVVLVGRVGRHLQQIQKLLPILLVLLGLLALVRHAGVAPLLLLVVGIVVGGGTAILVRLVRRQDGLIGCRSRLRFGRRRLGLPSSRPLGTGTGTGGDIPRVVRAHMNLWTKKSTRCTLWSYSSASICASLACSTSIRFKIRHAGAPGATGVKNKKHAGGNEGHKKR